MKVDEILNEMEIRGDTGEKPAAGELSSRAAEMKKRDQAKLRAGRDWGRGRRSSRLTGRGRGTSQADQSMIQK